MKTESKKKKRVERSDGFWRENDQVLAGNHLSDFASPLATISSLYQR
jgi:hypothetical protein